MITPSTRVNATAAALTTYYSIPDIVATSQQKIAAAMAVGGVISAFPESQQLAVRAGVSLFAGTFTACQLMPENTSLKGMGVTSIIAGAGIFLGLKHLDQLLQGPPAQVPTNPQQPQTTTTVFPIGDFLSPVVTAFTQATLGQTVGPLTVAQQAAMSNNHRVTVGAR